MKKKTSILIVFLLVMHISSFGENDSIPKNDPLYWDFELGISSLSSNQSVSNVRGKGKYSPGTGAWYIFYDLPLGSKKSKRQNHGFSVAPGFGLGFNTFNIDKLLEGVDGKNAFVPINYSYYSSYFSCVFLDIPVYFRYITKPSRKFQNFSLEFGGKAGFLLQSSKGVVTEIGSNSIKQVITRNLNGFNKVRYGATSKISYRIQHLSADRKKLLGMSLSAYTNYYLSPIFSEVDGENPHYYSFGIGVGFIF